MLQFDPNKPEEIDFTLHKADRKHQTHRIYILDLDGTMMPSNRIDNECYWQAVDEVLGGVVKTADLHEFVHVTDSGILLEWMEQERGRPANKAEVSEMKECFLELLVSAQKMPARAVQTTVRIGRLARRVPAAKLQPRHRYRWMGTFGSFQTCRS